PRSEATKDLLLPVAISKSQRSLAALGMTGASEERSASACHPEKRSDEGSLASSGHLEKPEIPRCARDDRGPRDISICPIIRLAARRSARKEQRPSKPWVAGSNPAGQAKPEQKVLTGDAGSHRARSDAKRPTVRQLA